MSGRATLFRLRMVLLLAVLLSLAASVLFKEHSYKVAASAGGGVVAGILVSLILRRVSTLEPKLWGKINENVAEAHELLRPLRSMCGTQSYSSPSSTKQNMIEMIEHPMVILLLVAMAWISWLDPAFVYSEPLNQLASVHLAKIIGTHILALLLMAFAVVGAVSAIQKRWRNAP